ncbi:MAG: hypothetical protein LBW85_02865 [Deltaproteobacteria bacterium]|nr:hypothetical protein [Deltaproteobacteria bacterium]
MSQAPPPAVPGIPTSAAAGSILCRAIFFSGSTPDRSRVPNLVASRII